MHKDDKEFKFGVVEQLQNIRNDLFLTNKQLAIMLGFKPTYMNNLLCSYRIENNCISLATYIKLKSRLDFFKHLMDNSVDFKQITTRYLNTI